MRDVVIGIVSGIIVVLVAGALKPAAAPPVAGSPSVVRQLPAGDELAVDELTRRYLPTTRPDPAAAKLARRIAGRDARGKRIDQVLQEIAADAGVNLYVDWRGLEAAGINSDATVGVSLREGPASELLRTVLGDIGRGEIALAYDLEDGVVHVSTKEQLAVRTVTRMYDVRDLVEGVLIRAVALGWKSPTDLPEGRVLRPTEQEVADALVRLLQEAIDPTSWRDAGGTIGGVRYFYGRLIVTQTPENQEAVMGLLGALRMVK
jgi:hypothetical protein